jgi:hypothetical protein
MWFWMTPQSPKPSAHDVMAGRWTPSAADRAAGRKPGFGEWNACNQCTAMHWQQPWLAEAVLTQQQPLPP